MKIHPVGSVEVSHVFPFAVGSPSVPGANVPDLRASWGSPPTAAICLASSRVIALLTAAALVDAGSWGKCFVRTLFTIKGVHATYLVLCNSSNLGICCFDARARSSDEADGPRVSLQCAINQRSNLTGDITRRLGIREGLISSCLLETCRILELKLSMRLSWKADKLTVIFPAPAAAAAFPRRPKTGSWMALGLLRLRLARTVVKNCSCECSTD